MYYAIFSQFRDNKPIRLIAEGTFTSKSIAYSAKRELEDIELYTDDRFIVKSTTVWKDIIYPPVSREYAEENPDIFGKVETKQQKWTD